MKEFDIAVIGGGVLGVSVSYWLSSLYDASVCVIESEDRVAQHASLRNTGIVHSPFYLNPDTHSEMASAMITSQNMWARLAEQTHTPWSENGVLQVATHDSQYDTLEKYVSWGRKNGMPEDSLRIMDAHDVAALEPNVKCIAAIHSRAEVATDFARLTSELAMRSEQAGSTLVFGFDVSGITRTEKGYVITGADAAQIVAKTVINCAGGRSLDVARMLGHAKDHVALHFRGEYWSASASNVPRVRTSVYSVPRYPDYPFLDPHWIVRPDGHIDVGPNAVPVAGPTSYTGTGGIPETLSKMREVLGGNARKILCDATFMRMAASEWLSSVSRHAMISRIRAFIPAARADMFTQRGMSGIRTPIVTPDGALAKTTMEIIEDGACSVINYNSPGATGAPAYAARLVQRLHDAGLVEFAGHSSEHIWTMRDVERE